MTPLPRIARRAVFPHLGHTAGLAVAVSLLVALAAPSSGAGEPAGYYASADPTNATTLRNTLHDIIDDHTRFPYTSSSTDTWDILEMADEDPGDSGRILDVYKNASYAKQGGGNSFYNREHTWPNSYGFPDDGSDNYPFTDCHQLHLCDSGYNSSRSNKPYRYASASANENPTDFNNGQGGGTGVYPGNSNWTSGQFTSGTWETWIGKRGDVARSLFYLDVRYEGDTHGITLVDEPDLILTDNEALIAASNTGNNEDTAYMGMLSVLLQWHIEDPVDDFERDRNDAIFAHQGNRNPFVDHPEWVACVFSASCGGDVTPPAAPTGLVATAGDGSVDLDWNDNGEPDLLGYSVYRSTSSGGPYTEITGPLVGTSDYEDTGLTNGTAYYYVVTASDTSSNESGFSGEASATPMAGTGPVAVHPWINEIHYDNVGSDTGEFVEIAGPAYLDLAGYSIVAYNGNGGSSYDTVALSGILPDQQECHGTIEFEFDPIQNGPPDGLALVDPMGDVVEFLSYEGAFSATDGPAAGMLSQNIGVSESGTTPVGFSLQLGGTGNESGDFSWQTEQAETKGSVNTGQTFTNPQWTDLGNGLAGSLGEPVFVGCGPLTDASDVTLALTNAAPGTTAYFILGVTRIDAGFKGGVLVPSPDIVIPIPTGAGTIVFGFEWFTGLPPGVTLYYQYWIVDGTGPLGFTASNAISGTTP